MEGRGRQPASPDVDPSVRPTYCFPLLGLTLFGGAREKECWARDVASWVPGLRDAVAVFQPQRMERPL